MLSVAAATSQRQSRGLTTHGVAHRAKAVTVWPGPVKPPSPQAKPRRFHSVMKYSTCPLLKVQCANSSSFSVSLPQPSRRSAEFTPRGALSEDTSYHDLRRPPVPSGFSTDKLGRCRQNSTLFRQNKASVGSGQLPTVSSKCVSLKPHRSRPQQLGIQNCFLRGGLISLSYTHPPSASWSCPNKVKAGL